VKDLIRNTQKVPLKLVEQLSPCKYELDVIKHAFEFGVSKALDLDYEFVNVEEKKQFNGQYTILLDKKNSMAKAGLRLTGWTKGETA